VPSSFAPLRHRPFALFWAGAFVSNIGTWMETVALGYYVADVTRQAAWTAVIAAAAFLPTAVLGPIGGALADRFPRKGILLVTTVVQAVLAGAVAVLVATGGATPALIALIVLATGCATAIGFPAYQAILPDLVPPEDLVAAIGLGSAQWNLGRIIGPLAAGGVIALAGVPTALAVNAVSFLAVVGVLLVLTLPRPRPDARDVSVFRSVVEGARFVWREPGLRVTIIVMCAVTFLAAPFIALLPAMAVKVLDGGEVTTAVLVAAQGVGAVVTALSLGSLVSRYGIRRVLTGFVTLLPLGLALYGLSPSVVTMVAALVVLGGLYLGCLSSFTTVAQQRSPGWLRGRVLAINTVVLGSLYPLGSVVQGRMADAVGLRAVTVGSAAVLAALVVTIRLVRPGFTQPIGVPPDPTGAGVVRPAGVARGATDQG
jgi:MFS family permease